MTSKVVLDKHKSIGGPNWLVGRHLIPMVRDFGAAARGIVLDVGCGTSPFQPYFSGASSYIRCDRFAAESDVIVADAEALPFEDQSVDTVLLFQVIGDFDDLVRHLVEIARVLKPEGTVLVYETVAYPEHDQPHDYWRVMPSGLAWAGGRAGLNVESLEPLGSIFARIGLMVNIFILGNMSRLHLPSAVIWVATAISNIAFGLLDGIFGNSRLGPDYLARLKKAQQ